MFGQRKLSWKSAKSDEITTESCCQTGATPSEPWQPSETRREWGRSGQRQFLQRPTRSMRCSCTSKSDSSAAAVAASARARSRRGGGGAAAAGAPLLEVGGGGGGAAGGPAHPEGAGG